MGQVIFPYKTIRDINLAGKTVLLRADYNVPINSEGQISDDLRITSSLDTVSYLIKHQAKVVIISHLGRPKGQPDEKYSLRPVAVRLSKLLGQEVKFITDCVGKAVTAEITAMRSGQVILLENLRFYPGETNNDPSFAKELATSSRADLFVQDGFGVVHRAHASTAAITEMLPSVAGFLLEREYTQIKTAIESPIRPLTTVIGGAKISDKMPMVRKFMDIADNVVIGGALANNFLRQAGYDVGDSLVEEGTQSLTGEIKQKADVKYGDHLTDRFILPVDVAVSLDGKLEGAKRAEKAVDQVKSPAVIYDIGEKTIKNIEQVIAKSGSVIWNGTLGMAEYPEFSRGSARLALAIAKKPHITSLIGGGDTADFVRKWDALKGGSFSHVSTGGGASLELMSGQDLPGIVALSRK